MDKRCCGSRCAKRKVTFEDAVVRYRKSMVREVDEDKNPVGEPHLQEIHWFGFMCDRCREGIAEETSPSCVIVDRMVVLQTQPEQFPEHAQERIAMLKLCPDGFYHPDIGKRWSDSSMVVFCRPPELLKKA
jgi:hypothetical protein